ncbi:hypothetical protein NBRC116493_22170 [Aurantivibrio infirmus]
MLLRDDSSNTQKFPSELKEAVCETLLRRLQWSVSGQGEARRELVGVSPAYKYVSGFLEPIKIPHMLGQLSDETTNPIHIISHGLDMEVVSAQCMVKIKPKFSMFVRLLPTSDHLKEHKVKLSLNDEAKKSLDLLLKEAGQKYDADNIELKENDKDRFFEEKEALRLESTRKYLTKKLGLNIDESEDTKPSDHDLSEDEMMSLATTSEGEDQDTSVIEDDQADTENSNVAIEYYVFPGMKSVIPGSVVKRVRPTARWLRIDIDNIPPIELDTSMSDSELIDFIDQSDRKIAESIRIKLEEWYNSDDEGIQGRLWAYPQNKKFSSEEIQNWDNTLIELRKTFPDKYDASKFSIPDLKIKWNIDVRKIKNEDKIALKITLENLTDTTRSRDAEVEYQESIFLTSLEVSLPLEQHKRIKLDRIKPSYRYNKYLTYPALGINCGINHSEMDDKSIMTTTWMPIYRQPRITPIHKSDIDVSFLKLSTPEGIDELSSIPDYFNKWIEAVRKSVDPTEGVTTESQKVTEEERFKQDVNQWTLEASKIKDGIGLLKDSYKKWSKNPNTEGGFPYLAWKYLNESMNEAAKSYDSWRLFQVCFILSQLGGISSRISEFEKYYDKEWDESVSLLYFATGGGKTESFFGLLIYNLFLDRLRGKYKGVTALIRYPLRLLTIQQAQRLAKTLASCEVVKRRNNLKGDSFSIGFWVGGGNTPNSRSTVSNTQVPDIDKVTKTEEERLENAEYRTASEDWNKLPKCPYCQNDTVLRRFPKKAGLIGHVCTSDAGQCEWQGFHADTDIEPLPFFIVDEDIYDQVPSVLLGTIDKLALLGHHPSTIRKFMGVLGAASFFDNKTNTFFSKRLEELKDSSSKKKVFPFFENGERIFYDPFPSLVIQDEAHLLEESLGTFSGIFETAFEAVLTILGKTNKYREVVRRIPETDQPRLPKIIAASATVNEPAHQMEELYQRSVTQFPVPGPSLYGSFYAHPKISEDSERNTLFPDNPEFGSCTARLYATLLTNGRPHTSATVEVLGHFHLLISKWLDELSSGQEEIINSTKMEMLECLFESPLKNIYQKYIDSASASEIATLIDLHRIALTYVTNKKGGDQIMAAENDTASRIHEDEKLTKFKGIESKLISGALSAGEIEEVIAQAEERPAPGKELADIFDESTLRSVVATSAISHGVDVDEFNTMFFAGMPSDPAEYIQSSSRIGRTHVGCSILLPTPQRRRDRYILETHDQYHRFLERMIRPAAINRWAESALIRTLPSLIQMYFIAVVELSELINEKDSDKGKVDNYERLNSIIALINREGRIESKDRLAKFVFDCVGLNHPKFAPPASEEFKKILYNELNEYFFDLVDSKYEEGIEGFKDFFIEINARDKAIKRMPMTSLRDVDPAGRIRYEKKVVKYPSSEEVYELMKRIQAGR